MEHGHMETSSLWVELPEHLRDFAEDRVRRGDYADVAAYLRDLVQRDREAQAADRLRELIQQGLDSGPARALTGADWAELRQRALQAKA
jgi:antitoxin ParD1/3/4